MHRSNYPSMTAQGFNRGGITKQINHIHRAICDAQDAYTPDDPTDTVAALLIAESEIQTALDMITSRYTIDLDAIHARLVKDSRELADEGVDVALWLESNEREAQ